MILDQYSTIFQEFEMYILVPHFSDTPKAKANLHRFFVATNNTSSMKAHPKPKTMMNETVFDHSLSTRDVYLHLLLECLEHTRVKSGRNRVVNP